MRNNNAVPNDQNQALIPAHPTFGTIYLGLSATLLVLSLTEFSQGSNIYGVTHLLMAAGCLAIAGANRISVHRDTLTRVGPCLMLGGLFYYFSCDEQLRTTSGASIITNSR